MSVVIERFIADNYLAAVDLAREAEKRIPNNVRLAALWPQMSRILTIQTDPRGVEVFFKKYSAPDEWRHLGAMRLEGAVWWLDYALGSYRTLPYNGLIADVHCTRRTSSKRLSCGRRVH